MSAPGPRTCAALLLGLLALGVFPALGQEQISPGPQSPSISQGA